MTRGHHEKSRPETSSTRAATLTKRKHHHSRPEEPQGSDEISRHSKRRRSRLLSESETLTITTDPPPTLAVCNRFDHFNYSSRRSRKHRHRKSSATEGTKRKWVFSSSDCSNYKGNKVGSFFFPNVLPYAFVLMFSGTVLVLFFSPV